MLLKMLTVSSVDGGPFEASGINGIPARRFAALFHREASNPFRASGPGIWVYEREANRSKKRSSFGMSAWNQSSMRVTFHR